MKNVTITRQWKRIMAVGCSHGNLINKGARDAVLKFRDRWKPDTVVHCGDFLDTAAFRSGAHGTADEARPISPDVECGLEFLEALRPTLILLGNHEDRLWKLAQHYNAIVQLAAAQIIAEINEVAAGLHAEVVPWNILNGYRIIGGYTYCHGWMIGENAIRDHAEALGSVVHAHTHRAGMAKGRRSDNPSGYCVGTLANIPALDYAKSRRSTLAWSSGFVWGEYCDERSVLWLHEQPRGEVEWRLPV